MYKDLNDFKRQTCCNNKVTAEKFTVIDDVRFQFAMIRCPHCKRDIFGELEAFNKIGTIEKTRNSFNDLWHDEMQYYEYHKPETLCYEGLCPICGEHINTIENVAVIGFAPDEVYGKLTYKTVEEVYCGED